MGIYSVIIFIRKITHPGTVQKWMRQCIQLGWNVSGSLHSGHINKSPFVLGEKNQNSKNKFCWSISVNVNTSGHVNGDGAAVGNAGEIPTKAERYIDARSFEVHS